MTRIETVLVAAALCFGLSASPGLAADGGPQQPADRGVNIVRWQVEVDGKKVLLASPIGEMAEVTRQDGTVVGLVPVLAPDGGLRFKLLDLTSSREGRLLDEVQVRPGEASFSKIRPDLSLTLLPPRTEKAAAQAGAPVRGLPLSETIIRWNLSLPDGQEVRLAVREGEIARLGIAGQWYGLAPRVKDRAAGEVSFRVFALVKGADGDNPRLLEGFALQTGAEHVPASLAGARLVLSGFEDAPATGMKSMTAALQDGLGGDEIPDGCCVRCGGTSVCGCAVQMDCGDCCVPPCCYWTY